MASKVSAHGPVRAPEPVAARRTELRRGRLLCAQASGAWELPEDALLLQHMAEVIQQLCDSNMDMRAVSPTIFDSVARPTMTVHQYLVRIQYLASHIAHRSSRNGAPNLAKSVGKAPFPAESRLGPL